MPETWDDKGDYLHNSRSLYHNADYWEFLVRGVWRLDREPCRVADFGCGCGYCGLMLLPLLAPGSRYTGFDLSAPLLADARRTFAGRLDTARFVRGDVHHAPFPDDTFDVAISHAVLMHVPDAGAALREMIRVTRPGGLVITCDANRNAASAALHIHETDEQEQTPLELFQTMNAHVRRETAVDYNLGLRMPVLMHRQGLENVQARVSDAVRLLFPPVGGEEKERLFDALCADGLGYQPTEEEAIRRWRESLVARGVAPEAAAREVERELERDFLHRGREYHTVYTGLLSFSFGTVKGSQDSMPRTWNPAGGGCDA